MKKALTLLLCAMALLSLPAGCKKHEEPAPNIVFTATVERVDQNAVLVSTADDVGFDKAQVSLSSAKPDFTLAVGQTVRLTILPQILESYPVQVTAVKIKLIAEPVPSDPEHPNFTASFFRVGSDSDNDFGFVVSRAQNKETMLISSVQHIPLVLVESASALNDFIREGAAYFQFDAAYDQEAALTEAFKRYDDDFFLNNRLVLLYTQESSGSIRHKIGDVALQNGKLAVTVNRIVPENYTDDMANWFILLEFSRDATAACTAWDAYYTADIKAAP